MMKLFVVNKQDWVSKRRISGAIFVIVGLAAFFSPEPLHAANCLYPDKKTGSLPNYSCLKPAERTLVDLRKFRADITVAALRCNQRSAYNALVTRHEQELVHHGKGLGAMFRRLHGAAATGEMNRYVTHLTNRASINSLGIRNYCHSMSRVFTEALKAPLRGLMAYVGRNQLAKATNYKPGRLAAPTTGFSKRKVNISR